jgi:hypothetical protein
VIQQHAFSRSNLKALLTADSPKLHIEAVKPDKLRVTYSG